MALQLDGGESKWWYGRVMVNGRKLKKNLGVEVRGVPPAKLTHMGDVAFERSRAKAQAALEHLQLDLKKRSTAEELVQTIHEIRTGSRVSTIPLNEAGARWKALPRRRPLGKRYVSQAESWMAKFVAFVNETNPAVKEMAQVQSSIARAFLRKEEERGVSAKTYNNLLIFLRSCFEALKEDGGIAKNPFAGVPTREEDTVFRKPFSAEELGAVLDAAKSDPFIYPIIVTGVCTAMRRGDCCCLLKSAIDLPNRFIKVKTSKTGELVQIPMLPLLQGVLEKLPANDSPYAFPEQEMKYQLNPDNITLRARRVMRAAGFFDPDDAETEEEKKKARGEIHQPRTNGLRKASVRDFHSFRVTWVTLALSAGVPLEIVQKVTGHRTAAIVLKHYFQPGREDYRRTLTGKLPAILGGQPEAAPLTPVEIRTRVEAMKPRTWKKLREELLARLPADPKSTGAKSTEVSRASAPIEVAAVEVN